MQHKALQMGIFHAKIYRPQWPLSHCHKRLIKDTDADSKCDGIAHRCSPQQCKLILAPREGGHTCLLTMTRRI